jgi:hypothetical protein
MLQTVRGNKALTYTFVFEWFKEFKEGYNDHENDPKSWQSHEML